MGSDANIESILSRIRLLEQALGSTEVQGLNSDGYKELGRKVCANIGRIVGVSLPKQRNPYSELIGWIGDTWTAKGENEDLRKERDQLRKAAVDGANAVRENKVLKRQLDIDESLALADYAPVTARDR